MKLSLLSNPITLSGDEQSPSDSTVGAMISPTEFDKAEAAITKIIRQDFGITEAFKYLGAYHVIFMPGTNQSSKVKSFLRKYIEVGHKLGTGVTSRNKSEFITELSQLGYSYETAEFYLNVFIRANSMGQIPDLIASPQIYSAKDEVEGLEKVARAAKTGIKTAAMYGIGGLIVYGLAKEVLFKGGLNLKGRRT